MPTHYKRQLLLDLMVTAFEGGSDWLHNPATNVKRDKDLNYLSVTITPDETGDPDLDHAYTITPETMQLGLERLHQAALNQAFPSAATHYGDAIGQQWDALTADIVLQMGMFGQIIFG